MLLLLPWLQCCSVPLMPEIQQHLVELQVFMYRIGDNNNRRGWVVTALLWEIRA